MKIINVVGARPNFMKIAPLMEAYRQHPGIEPVLLHTGQHYDEKMSDLFFRELGIPEPDVNLGVGSGSHAKQTAAIMSAFEDALLEIAPDAVLVVGDVNSTIACGLVASKLGIKLIHVEAGLRSFDRQMPEEINRILTDSISDLLFCTEQSGLDNLKKEGVPDEKVHLVGNVMIDNLIKQLPKAAESRVLESVGVSERGYALMTLHRPSNVDDPQALARIIAAVKEVQRDLTVVFPCHPRTRKILSELGGGALGKDMPNVHLIEPVGYFDFLRLMSSAKIVLSDSGGVQEETTYLRIPCLTLRENTERPSTLDVGSARLVGSDTKRILDAFHEVAGMDQTQFQAPPLWDGKAAERIAERLAAAL